MRTLLFLSALSLLSCKKDPAPPAAAERKSPLVELIKAPGVLSVFEPAKDQCEWRRVDVATKRSVVVANFPGACVGARVSWSPDGLTAAVWFDPKRVQSAGIGGSDIGAPGYPDEAADAAAKGRLFTVQVVTGLVKPLALPAVEIDELGVNAKGDVVVLSLEELSEAAMAAKKITVDEKEFALAPVTEGMPALAHAWRWTGAAWTRFETVQTTTGWDFGLGVRELKAMASFGPRSSDLLETHPGQSSEVEDAMLKQLATFAPKKGDGTWTASGAAGTRAFAYVITAEFGYTTGLIVFEAPALGLAKGIGFSDGELVALRNDGPFLLVSSGSAGTHPRVYDRASGALRYSSDAARAVTFWP